MNPDDIGQLTNGVPINVTVIPKAVEIPGPGTVISPDTSTTTIIKEGESMFGKLITGNEKAVAGGFTSGILALLAQIGVNNQLTIKEAVYSIVGGIITHVMIWITANTKA